MKLVAHASPLSLEAELLDRIAAVKSADPLAPVLVVVPSRRLADHVKGRLAERFGAVLGVSVVHHGMLAAKILEKGGVVPPRVIGDDLIATIFDGVVQRAPAGPVRDFVRDHSGAGVAMLKALTDLREAGIDPAVVTRLLSGAEVQTADLYARFASVMDEIGARGRACDDAGLVRAALPFASNFAGGFAAIFHHGAYDLIGLRVALVRALDEGRELTFLVPADPAADGGGFGIRRASSIAGSSPSTIAGDGAGARDVTFANAQGARAELKTAVYEALAAVVSGTPPREIAIVMRTFHPYAAALDELFDRGEIAWHTSYTRPLLRDRSAANALSSIAAGPDRGRKTFGEHAVEFEQTAGAAAGALQPLLQSMRDIEDLLQDYRAVGRAEACAWVASRAAAAQAPPAGADGGGIRILDAMQARGMTFSHLLLCGMNAGLFPNVAREHPFLSDRSKARLAEATGTSLPLAGERDGEEKLLLAMTLRAARLRIAVSWLRADDEARPVTASLSLGEVAELAGVGTLARDAESVARSIPAHPRARLEAWAANPGILDPRDESILTALSSELGADAGPAVVSRMPQCSSGVALLAATEAFDATTGIYDGRVGRSVLDGRIAATALERLAWCPMRFFFRDVLKVDDTRRLWQPFEVDHGQTGTRVHEALSEVYRRLRDEGRFASDDLDGRIARARELLREAWLADVDEERAERAARVPLLDRIETESWLARLEAFLRDDLTRLARDGAVPEQVEENVRGVIPGGPPGLVVDARLDRVVSGKSGRTVGDYKTGGSKLAERLSPSAMLSGESLQAPIYSMLTSSRVELLGVGPRNLGQVAPLERVATGPVEAGIIETIDAALALAASGRFPIHAGEHCARCAYRTACRHGHPPTTFRETHTSDVADARDCWDKTSKLPSLRSIRQGRP